MSLPHVVTAAVLAASSLIGCGPVPSVPRSAETFAFCGVHPDDAYAQRKANTLANVAGIDASFGPCMPPDWDTYSPAFPGQRYISPDDYLRLTTINAIAGMKTIVYDARIWSADPVVRQQALDFWYPHLAWIRGWDMGDEFDPRGGDWVELVQRWNIVLTHITPNTLVGPITNHLGMDWVLEQALMDLDGHSGFMSYDLYNIPASLGLARRFAPRTSNLMCAINAVTHNSYVATPSAITSAMRQHRRAGCDSFLIFGGDKPIDTPGFFTDSLVTWSGSATPLANAVRRGAQ